MNELTAKIEQDLKNILTSQLSITDSGERQYREIYEYALLPAGKLFRSQLIWSVFGDLNNQQMRSVQTLISPNHQFLSAAIEVHHAYTLVHDDMPCMDNDDYRRGKLSTHKKYGEWKALLIGDGLLNMSYQILSEINHPNAQHILHLFTKSCGHNGLILGQYLDLNVNSSPKTFDSIKRIHQLKTGKLFDCAIMGSYLISEYQSEEAKNKLQIISSCIGELFQFLDDLTELPEVKTNTHESEINPWISFYNETINETLNLLSMTNKNLDGFSQTRKAIYKYFEKIRLFLLSNKPEILKVLKPEDLEPLVLALE